MSDEEERVLWRKAMEESPAVVRWLEARFRRETPSEAKTPKFLRTYSMMMLLTPGAIGNLPIDLPAMEGHPRFHLMGMSIFVSGFNEPGRTLYESFTSAMDNLRSAIVRIYCHDHCYRFYEHPMGVLLVSTSEPFQPGWVSDLYLSSATSIRMEIPNPTSQTLSFRAAVHGSFENEK